MAKEETIQQRFNQLLTGTRFEENKELLGRILGLAFEEQLFAVKESE